MPKINPDPHGHPTFRPQYPIRMSDMRRMWDNAEAANRSASTFDYDVGGGMGTQIAEEPLPNGFYARLTTPAVSSSVALYSFSEVIDDGTGQDWRPPNAALRGDSNAFEINKNASIIVPGPPQSLTAVAVAGGTLTSGVTLYYVVTATWQDADGNTLQLAFCKP